MELEINGHRVYAASGNRQPSAEKETVLFLHGTGQDHTIWVLPTRYFARHGRNVLAVDLPGHGRSGGEPLDTIEALADWAIAVLDAAGLESTAIVGHSLGSLVAVAAAARHPDRVRAIALVGTTVPMPVSDVLLEKAERDDHQAIEMLNYWGFSKWHPRSVGCTRKKRHHRFRMGRRRRHGRYRNSSTLRCGRTEYRHHLRLLR